MLRRILIATCVILHLVLLVGLRTTVAANLPLSHEQAVYTNIVLLAIASIAAIWRRQLTAERKDWMLPGIIALYGLSVLVPTVSTHSLSLCSVEASLTPLTIFCFVWAVPKALTRRDLDVVFLGVISLFTVHALLTAYLVATNTHILFGQELYCGTGRPRLYWGDRGALLTGLFANPNALASYLMLLPALAFSMAARWQRTWTRTFLASSGVLLLVHLLSLMSRAASLTTLTALAVAGVSSKRLKPWFKYVALGAVLGSLIFACHALYDWRYDSSLCLRAFIWQGFFDGVLANPFGSGWNGVSVFNENPHNFLLANLVYFGVVGLALLLTLLIMLMSRAAHTCRQDPSSLVLVLSLASMLLVHQSVEYVVTYPLLFSNSMFWLLLGYLQLSPAGPSNERFDSMSQPHTVTSCPAKETRELR